MLESRLQFDLFIVDVYVFEAQLESAWLPTVMIIHYKMLLMIITMVNTAISFYIIDLHSLSLLMKRVLTILEEYLKKYPSPSSISKIGNVLKLQHTYSNPYTDSKLTKQSLFTLKTVESHEFLEIKTKNLSYNDKGKVQQSNSFDSILSKDKHQKLMQDDVFGKAHHNKDLTRWVYVAEIKQETVKSYFNQGKGKSVHKYDFGETYQGIKQVGIFIWDKTLKKIFRLQIEKDLIPACPSFFNEDSSEIIFHAYKRQNFGHGLLHCFNRPVKIYRAKISLQKKESKDQKKQSSQLVLKSQITQLINDSRQTAIAPLVSPCFNYLIYFSGTGITHTYYLDLVIMKKTNEGVWAETHRIKQFFVGYYNHLRTYFLQEKEQTFAIVQTQERSTTQIYKINVETGNKVNLTEKHQNCDFSLSQVNEQGILLGTATSNNFNTHFHSFGGDIQLVKPQSSQNFITTQINKPFHSILVEARQEDIFEDYRDRINKRPLIVFPHGGPHGSFIQALTALRFALLKMGYILLYPNPPASIGYGDKYVSDNLKQIGSNDAGLIVDQICDILKSRKDIDQSRIYSHGGSYGGFMSAIFGSRYSNIFASVVILNGVLNNIANMWFTDIPEWVTVETCGKAQLHQLTKEDYQQMWEQSPISLPLKVPALQFLGAKDLRVPHRQGLLYDAIAKQNGTSINTYVYENSSHSLADSVETSIDIVVKTILFLEGVKDQQDK